MHRVVMPLVICFLVGFWGFMGYSIYEARTKRTSEVQAFLDENKGVVKVSSVVWTRDKGWEYKVSGFLGGKEFAATPAPNTNPNPGEFWKGKSSCFGVILTEKTKCP